MIAKTTPTPKPRRRFSRGRRAIDQGHAQRRQVGLALLLPKQGRPNGVLRVAVVGGGCSGLQYKMDLQDSPANRDFLVETGGIRVVVDPKSALYVTGSELDYVDALQERFQSEKSERRHQLFLR